MQIKSEFQTLFLIKQTYFQSQIGNSKKVSLTDDSGQFDGPADFKYCFQYDKIQLIEVISENQIRTILNRRKDIPFGIKIYDNPQENNSDGLMNVKIKIFSTFEYLHNPDK